MRGDDNNCASTAKSQPKMPRSIWALGFVSMLMDISSEMIHALLPLYMVSVLGASVIAVGFIEGIAESTASFTKVFSGALSDRLGKRKLLTVIGYGLSALMKPVFPMASGLEWLTAARFVDRVGKGIRGHRVMHWWPMLRRSSCAARRSACVRRSIPWALSSGHCWRSC